MGPIWKDQRVGIGSGVLRVFGVLGFGGWRRDRRGQWGGSERVSGGRRRSKVSPTVAAPPFLEELMKFDAIKVWSL